MEPLILLHGALGSRPQLTALAEQLAQHYDVHALDFPGHGGTPLPEQFSISSFAQYVQEYCKAQGLTKVSLFGYSLGGYVALYLARQQPQLVNRVVTLATKFHWDEATAAREVKMLQPDAIEQKVPQFARTLQERHAPADWKEVLRHTASMMEGLGKQNALAPEDYKEISCPCLLMLGDRDKMVTLEETVAVYRQLPHGQLAVLPNTPHPLEGVATDRLVQMILQGLL
jgi:pimeloyl-ACP methyl ester carboxylesterase